MPPSRPCLSPPPPLEPPPRLSGCLLLYYDEVEVCNPLGTARGKHKIGAFYYSILNLPSRLRASRSGVQIFALANHKSYVRHADMERLAFFAA